MLNFYQQMAGELEHGAVVLATVAMTKGAVPREVGAKMLVTTDGRIIGTIGGGAGEAKVYRQAQTVLQSDEKQFVEIDLSGAPHREIQGVCGGMMRVWVERWDGQVSMTLVHQILTVLQGDLCQALVTPFCLQRSPYLEESDRQTIQIDQNCLIEPLLPPPTLAIIGAGHVAVPLAQIAQIAGFQIIVIDDRPEFARSDRFPNGAIVLAQPVRRALEALPVKPFYAALVTRGYQHDLEPLQILLQRPMHYIGMIGSHKRVQLVHQALLDKSYSHETLQKIHAPIGLNIGALTPEEIAVSICAELIKIRRMSDERS